MALTNKDKNKPSDTEVAEALAEEIPNEEIEIQTDIPEDEILPEPENEEPKDEVDVESISKEQPKVEPTNQPIETPEQKEQRYKAQQAEAQVQFERNKALIDKFEKAGQIATPTIDELKAYVRQDGVDWDELTTFEQSMAKKTYISEKKSDSFAEAVTEVKQIDSWSKSVDEFIDSTEDKPEYVELSSHEADFRKFALKDSHRGTPVDILLGAFLHQLPPLEKKKGSMFESGGGGEKTEVKTHIDDADTAKQLRENNPREYKRLLKAGKIKLDV